MKSVNPGMYLNTRMSASPLKKIVMSLGIT